MPSSGELHYERGIVIATGGNVPTCPRGEGSGMDRHETKRCKPRTLKPPRICHCCMHGVSFRTELLDPLVWYDDVAYIMQGPTARTRCCRGPEVLWE
jgi:hypothetical protein